MDGKCTVYFEDPFWVAVSERIDEDGYSVARFVFGSEPMDAELHEFAARQFAARQFAALSFSLPGPAPEPGEREIGFKRRQREARKQTQQQGVDTYAQRALQAERERMKQVRRAESQDEREAGQRQKFLLKQAQKKEKHRGR
jgi:hypothetical protein